MSIESVKTFYKLIQSDETLQERVTAADDSATVVQIASEKGYEFTEQELERAMQEAIIEGELSQEELEAVAGAGKKYKGPAHALDPDETYDKVKIKN
ncbi:MAG: Nif11-like leader peptide family natural product precursor [Xenococcaceae cyanobacterium]